MKRITTSYTLFILLTALFSINTSGQTTSLVSIDDNGHLTYNPDAKGNVLPDFSYVGYHHGEKPIPDVAVVKTISPVEGDNRANIQSAIDVVAIRPADANGHKGAVLLTEGLYEVSGTIFMESGVVLRGMGNSTRIRAVYTNNDPVISTNSGNSQNYSLTSATRKKITDAYVPFGARSFTIESGHSFKVGDRVALRREPTNTWANIIGGDNVAPDSPWGAGGYNINFLRVVKAVNGNRITIDAPVVDHIYSGIANGYLFKYTNSVDHKTEIGIEDLRLESDYANEKTLNHSNTGISVRIAENGWIRNVDAYHFTGNLVSFNGGAYKWTVDNCRYLRPVGVLNSGTRYSFSINTDAHQVLIQNCFSDFGRHDFATGSRTPGPSVFSNCKAMNCWNVSGPHHRWATGILYDRVYTDLDLNVENRTDSGSGHGYAGANHVMWNCSTYSRMTIHNPPTDADNWAIGCIAAEGVTGVGRKSTEARGLTESEGMHIEAIPILYRAQLDDRLGAGTASTDNPFPGFTGDQTVYPNELTIQSAVAGVEAQHHGVTRLAEHSYDNDVHTRWASDRDDGNASRAWIEYTLDGSYEIYSIRMQLFNSWIRTYPIKIQVDGNTVYTGTSQLTEELGWNEIIFSPISGSKVKISMIAKNSYDYAELCMHETKIYGAGSDQTKYELTINSGVGDGSYVEGSMIAIKADDAPNGKAFDQWTGDVAGIEDVFAAETRLMMPASNVQLTASFQNTYDLSVNSGSGDGAYVKGEAVVVAAGNPPSGTVFDQWTGSIATLADIYASSTTLTMPASDIQITAIYQIPLKLAPVADTYVRAGINADENFGSEQKMEIKERPDNLMWHREGYLKFDLSSIPKDVNSATLRLYVKAKLGGAFHNCAFVEDDSWTESGLTYNNKPAESLILDTQPVPGDGSWIEFDVTDQVKTEMLGDDIISFQITDEAIDIQTVYDTKEGANPPELIYGLAGASESLTIAASAGANGSISPGGTFTLKQGSNQVFMIWPDAGYEIEDVQVDGTSVGAVNLYTFSNVTADHTITASFTQSFTITASAESSGLISPSGTITVNEGADQTFEISAKSGYEIEDVLVDGNSVGAVSSYTFSKITEDHSISASFAHLTHSITASAGANGSITPDGMVTVNQGSGQTFAITADTGYLLDEVLVDGTSVGAVSTYTFPDVQEDHTISASFMLDPATSSANLIEQGAQGVSAIKIYPNPSNGMANIVGIDGRASLRIYDLLGKELMHMEIFGPKALDLSKLKAGVYLIEVRESHKSVMKRFIKR